MDSLYYTKHKLKNSFKWKKSDKTYPVKRSICAECKYKKPSNTAENRYKLASDYACNYVSITGNLKPQHSVTDDNKCLCFEKGKPVNCNKKTII